jgi:hypothetical protein
MTKAYINDGTFVLITKRLCFDRQCDVNSWLRYTPDAIEQARVKELKDFVPGDYVKAIRVAGDLLLLNFAVTQDEIRIFASSRITNI